MKHSVRLLGPYFAFFALLRRPRTDIKPPARQSDPFSLHALSNSFAEKQFRERFFGPVLT